MRLITFEDKDALALLDRLELKRLQGPRADLVEDLRSRKPEEAAAQGVLDALHRAFHYEVVRWLQEQGARCVR